MKILNALAAGFAGAVVLTITHQLLHKISDDAPRMDLMGEEALLKMTDGEIDVSESELYNITMTGDIVGNTLYYALTAAGKPEDPNVRGTLLGMAAGMGGVILPKYIGLTNSFSDRTMKTKLMTIAMYTLGGWVTGRVYGMLRDDNNVIM